MGESFSTKAVQQIQPTDRLVYLVTNDHQFAAFLSQQIIHFGYYVQQVRDYKSLSTAASHHAVAILVDISSQDDGLFRNEIFDDITEYTSSSLPLVFISDHDDQAVRLQSIEAGGTAFLTKPISIVRLIDQLDILNSPNTKITQPYRVLIVENQLSVASYYQMVLKMSGMDAQYVTNSANVLDQVRDFHPDLILMDTFMPEIKGTDLARIIRQIEEYVSIPIVFLSSEDDFDKRIEALNLGADDFLVKPVKASHLMAVVRSRLERLKILRSFMVRDSLTNLLNHTAFRSVLTKEVSRCKRQNAKLALAMLDIDHFKRVNDTYGHSTGDSVLKSLSRLLKQRLRSSDIVGRYGGEEFVALLLDCELEQAFKIMDELRTHFSKIDFFPSKNGALSVTFSCGISTFPEYESHQDLSDASDQALYRAKDSGRNMVVVAKPR